jgi:serine/threonine protein kinase
LIDAHERAGSILDRPVVEPFATMPVERPVAADMAGRRPELAHPRAAGGVRANRGGDDPIELSFLQPSQQPDMIGRLEQYEVMEVLGQGGFGVVLKAFDERLRRVVALKVLKPSLAVTSPPRKRFLREARSAAAVRHDNVVTIYAVEDTPTPYLVMECVTGRSLQQKLDETGPLDLPEVLRIGQQIAHGLAASHATGLIHHDIKPSNIMLADGSGQVKITDFGLARTVDDANLSQSRFIIGTPLYMAPEQALVGVVDQRSDLFSLGSVLYAACSGRPPFRAPTTFAVLKRLTEDTPRPIREIIPETPEWLCAIIAKLQAKDPADRYGTALEVAQLLERCRSDLTQPRGSQSPVEIRPAVGSPGPVESGARDQAPHTSPGTLQRVVPWPRRTILAGTALLLVTAAALIFATLMRVLGGRYDGAGSPAEAAGEAAGREQAGTLGEFTPPGPLRPKHLDLSDHVIVDLTPFQGRPLESLSLLGNPVHDLWPLHQSPLNRLNLWFTQVDDRSLAALNGMKTLRWLNLGGTKVTDLSEIRQLKLEILCINVTEIGDLSPLGEMPLTILWMDHTRVEDLAPIKGMRLKEISYVGSPIGDISVLRGMPLEGVACDFNPGRDARILRSIPTLKTINGQPAAEFWKSFDARHSHSVPR